MTEQKNLENKDAGNIEFKKPKEFERIESPNFIRFENIGDTVEGILINKDTSASYGFGLYTIKINKKEQKRFHGSAQLDDLLMGIEPLTYIKITYTSTQETPMGTMKVFEVEKGIN